VSNPTENTELGYGLNTQGIMVRFSAAVKDISYLQSTQHGYEANPDIY